MSGGEFDYLQHRLDYEVARRIQREIADNKKKPDWWNEKDWEGQKWRNETIQEFKNGLEIIRKAYVYMQRIDYLLSGDDGEETFHERLKEDLENFGFYDWDGRDEDD